MSTTSSPHAAASSTRRTRLFASSIAAGLALEAVALAHFGPGSFVGFALVGIPLILVGTGYFAMRVVTLALRKDQ